MTPDNLAKRINVEHELCVAAARSAVEHAIRAGRLLIEAKGSLGHGKFLSWIEAHCDFGERMAQRYMKAARWRELNPTRETDLLSLRDVMAEVASPPRDPDPDPEPEASPPELDRHELNKCLPAMTGDEFSGLCESIAQSGLRYPVLLFEGKVLDGWHRYLACAEVGVEPRFVEFEGAGEDALKHFISSNLVRHNLTPSQKAACDIRREQMESAVGEASSESAMDSAHSFAQETLAEIRRVGREQAWADLAGIGVDVADKLIAAADALAAGASPADVASLVWSVEAESPQPKPGLPVADADRRVRVLNAHREWPGKTRAELAYLCYVPPAFVDEVLGEDFQAELQSE